MTAVIVCSFALSKYFWSGNIKVIVLSALSLNPVSSFESIGRRYSLPRSSNFIAFSISFIWYFLSSFLSCILIWILSSFIFGCFSAFVCMFYFTANNASEPLSVDHSSAFEEIIHTLIKFSNLCHTQFSAMPRYAHTYAFTFLRWAEVIAHLIFPRFILNRRKAHRTKARSMWAIPLSPKASGSGRLPSSCINDWQI